MHIPLAECFDPVEFVLASLETWEGGGLVRGRPTRQIIQEAHDQAEIEAFSREVQRVPAYWRLCSARVHGRLIVEMCTMFRAMLLATPTIKEELPTPARGRPQTLLPLFKFCGDMMVHGRSDKRKYCYRDHDEKQRCRITIRDSIKLIPHETTKCK